MPARPKYPRPSTAGFLALPAALFLAGCTDDGTGGSGLSATVDTVTGTEVVRYPHGSGTVLEWSFDTVAVIGGAGVDTSAYYRFDQVPATGLAGDSDGHLFVLDAAGRRVLEYDAWGRHMATYGNEGAGPGELQGPVGLALGPDGAPWVLDVANRRVLILGRETADSRAVPFPAGDRAPAGKLAAAGNGYLAALSYHVRPGDDSPPPPISLVRFGPDGAVRDTLWTAPPRPGREVPVQGSSGSFSVPPRPALFPRFRWEVLSDGTTVVSVGADYVLHFLNRRGDPLRAVQREPPARPTTDADRIPRIQGLRADPRDRLWVGVSEESLEGVDRIDVLAPDGTLIGEIRDPPFFPDLLFGDGLAALLGRDQLGVQQVVVLRVRER